MPSTILFIGCNHTDCTATFSIDGARWEYFFANTSVLNAIIRIARYSAGKALVQAKHRGVRAIRQ